jgi:hypothetical protein
MGPGDGDKGADTRRWRGRLWIRGGAWRIAEAVVPHGRIYEEGREQALQLPHCIVSVSEDLWSMQRLFKLQRLGNMPVTSYYYFSGMLYYSTPSRQTKPKCTENLNESS